MYERAPVSKKNNNETKQKSKTQAHCEQQHCKSQRQANSEQGNLHAGVGRRFEHKVEVPDDAQRIVAGKQFGVAGDEQRHQVQRQFRLETGWRVVVRFEPCTVKSGIIHHSSFIMHHRQQGENRHPNRSKLTIKRRQTPSYPSPYPLLLRRTSIEHYINLDCNRRLNRRLVTYQPRGREQAA